MSSEQRIVQRKSVPSDMLIVMSVDFILDTQHFVKNISKNYNDQSIICVTP